MNADYTSFEAEVLLKTVRVVRNPDTSHKMSGFTERHGSLSLTVVKYHLDQGHATFRLAPGVKGGPTKGPPSLTGTRSSQPKH